MVRSNAKGTATFSKSLNLGRGVFETLCEETPRTTRFVPMSILSAAGIAVDPGGPVVVVGILVPEVVVDATLLACILVFDIVSLLVVEEAG